MQITQIFERHRNKLIGIAYRITGSITEAEDIVQESFIRWNKVNPDEIQTPEAWLCTVVTRLSLDYVKSAQHQRQSYIGPWLPEPFIDFNQAPCAQHEIDQSITMALMVLLDQLSATERASYILHDLFDYSFNEVADILGRSSASCRKLASRSREKIHSKPKQAIASSMQYQQLIEAFFSATRDDNEAALLQLLSDDVVFYSDGGGKASAAPRILIGRSEVMAWFSRVLSPVFKHRQRRNEKRSIEWFNGSPGLVLWQGSEAISAFSFTIEDSAIKAIHALRNPDKLCLFTAQQ